ncbi:tyrosine-type recombinase/integrase [Salinigranum halophilum]|uniref:tyrosine-type recombinase/integrase n=1 Tax=Salinigranum halophilum TaxID=2565931 RepID=UPI0010A8E8E1|nr:site-specific integrase [Salinigranum halophilum]
MAESTPSVRRNSVDDPNNAVSRYHNALDRLKTNDVIAKEDREAIIRVINQMEATGHSRGDYSPNSLYLYVNSLRKLGEATDTPLTEYESIHEFNNTILELKRDGISHSYRRSMRSASRRLFEMQGAEWWEDIEIGKPKPTKVTPDDVFTPAEANRILEHAKDPRNKAILAMLLATGQRVCALQSLKVGDIHIDKHGGYFKLNGEAVGLKGANGGRPLIWAKHYVANWLDVHPSPEDPNAALFGKTRDGSTYVKGDPLTSGGISDIIKKTCKAADVPERKRFAHNFRHTAITRMVRDDVNEQRIKFLVGWKKDSSMFEVYSKVTDTDHIRDINRQYGADVENDGVGVGITFEECPNPSCGASLAEWVDPVACPRCGGRLSQRGADAEKRAEEGNHEAETSGAGGRGERRTIGRSR